MEKKEAREVIQEAVEGLGPLERTRRSDAIRRRLLDLPELQRAQCVMGYLPMPDEWDTRPFLGDLIAAGKRVYVPRTFVKARHIVPVRLSDLDDLREGEYGIPEPDTDETCSVGELDFILVPARAFDQQGNRLGRGAGFYDRFMAAEEFTSVRCGAAFACQVLPQVPHDDHDLPVHILVTESETVRISDF